MADGKGKTSQSPATPRRMHELGILADNASLLQPPPGYVDSKSSTDPPAERLKLDWVYGYRGNDCRSNLHIVHSGEIIYFIGSVVVLYNRDQHVQRHYREHSSEIKCIAVHPNGVRVASGQAAQETVQWSSAHIRVWRSDTLQTLHVLGDGTLRQSVVALSFSSEKDLLSSVDMAKGHELRVWNSSTGKHIANTNMDLELVCDVDFNPHTPNVMAVIGKEHIGWWALSQDGSNVHLQCKADYQNYLRAKFITCLLHTDKGDLITGDSNGTVYVWKQGGNIVTNIIKHAHDGPVFCLFLTRGNLLTGGRDGKLLGWYWGKNMDQSGQVEVPAIEGGVRSLQLHKDQLLIGTTTNSILTATLSGQALRNPLSGVKVQPVRLTQGHFDQLHGLCAIHEGEHEGHMLTAGRDGIVGLFNPETKQPIWKHMLKKVHVTCCDLSRNGQILTLGTKNCIYLYTIQWKEKHQVDFNDVCKVDVDSQRLTRIKLSPDCQRIAVGDDTGSIHIIGIAENDEKEEIWEEIGTCQGHNSSITALDWSIQMYNGAHLIRSSSSSKELFCWDSERFTRIGKDVDLRAIRWSSCQCQLTFSVAGIWYSKQAKEAGVTSLDVNSNGTLIVMGDGQGYISMFKYPCCKKGAFSHKYKAHQLVSDARFSGSGRYLVSVDGYDSTMVQWKLV